MRKGYFRQEFECTRMISPEQVIATIKKIPTFRPAEQQPDAKDGKNGKKP